MHVCSRDGQRGELGLPLKYIKQFLGDLLQLATTYIVGFILSKWNTSVTACKKIWCLYVVCQNPYTLLILLVKNVVFNYIELDII
jgi:hypothetical protein